MMIHLGIGYYILYVENARSSFIEKDVSNVIRSPPLGGAGCSLRGDGGSRGARWSR